MLISTHNVTTTWIKFTERTSMDNDEEQDRVGEEIHLTTVRLPKPLWKRAKYFVARCWLAGNIGFTFSDIVQQALEEYLSRHEQEAQ